MSDAVSAVQQNSGDTTLYPRNIINISIKSKNILEIHTIKQVLQIILSSADT